MKLLGITIKRSLMVFFGWQVILQLSSCKTPELATRASVFTYDRFTYCENDYLQTKNNVGIAFSGGGSRSASLTTGQLRGLNKLEVLNNVKYISAVSGGAWASTCYTYSTLGDEELLGQFKKPSDLNIDNLTDAPNGVLLDCVSDSYVAEPYWNGVFTGKGDEIMAHVLEDIYLKKLELDENRYLGYTKESVQAIIDRQKMDSLLSYDDFYLTNPKDNRPFLIVNGTVVGGSKNTGRLPSMHLEMTPLYSGVTYYNYANRSKIGGGYVESFAIDYKLKKRYNDYYSIKQNRNLQRRFTLSDMMAVTGNAPGTALYKIGILRNVGLPELKLWSPLAAKTQPENCHVQTKEFAMADGGNLENLGLIPLLKRKVKTIIVFVNCKTPIKKLEDENGNDYVKLDNSIDRAFGIEVDAAFAISTNLLSNCNNEYKHLADTLYKRKMKGEPLIYRDNYTINPNPDYGIMPIKDEYETVNITWVYNDGFEKQYVKPEMNAEVRDFYFNKGFDSFNAKFPHLPTARTSRKNKLIDYDIAWANMLAHFSSWVVNDNAELFKGIIHTAE